jgi:hypothetical protein
MDLPLTGYTVHVSQKASEEAGLESHGNKSMGLKITCPIQRRARHRQSMGSNQGAYMRGELPLSARPPRLSPKSKSHALPARGKFTTVHIYRQGLDFLFQFPNSTNFKCFLDGWDGPWHGSLTWRRIQPPWGTMHVVVIRCPLITWCLFSFLGTDINTATGDFMSNKMSQYLPSYKNSYMRLYVVPKNKPTLA